MTCLFKLSRITYRLFVFYPFLHAFYIEFYNSIPSMLGPFPFSVLLYSSRVVPFHDSFRMMSFATCLLHFAWFFPPSFVDSYSLDIPHGAPPFPDFALSANNEDARISKFPTTCTAIIHISAAGFQAASF